MVSENSNSNDEFIEVKQHSFESDIESEDIKYRKEFDSKSNSTPISQTKVDVKASHKILSKSATIILLLIVFLLLIGIAIFVWPTKWRYDSLVLGESKYPVRVNRFTDRTEMFTGRNWIAKEAEKDVTAELFDFEPQELQKIEGRLSVTNYGYIKADLYNGTSKQIHKVHVRLIIMDKNAIEDINRVYELSGSGGAPLKSSEYSVECGCSVKDGQTFSWTIERAMWSK